MKEILKYCFIKATFNRNRIYPSYEIISYLSCVLKKVEIGGLVVAGNSLQYSCLENLMDRAAW